MQQRHQISALVLLAVFLVGGFVAPWVHHVEHGTAARDRTLADQERIERLGHTGSESGGYLGEEVEAFHDLFCHLCLRLFVTAPLQEPALVAYLNIEALTVAASSPLTAATLPYKLIRAPPLLR